MNLTFKLMKTINDRLAYLVETKADGVVMQFASMLSTNDQNIRNITVSKRNKPGFDLIASILQTFDDINPDWLILGEGSPIRDKCKGETIPPEMFMKRYEELIIENKELRDQVAKQLVQKKGAQQSSTSGTELELDY